MTAKRTSCRRVACVTRLHDLRAELAEANARSVRYDRTAKYLPPGLPSPRLQLRWEEGAGEQHTCHYELVFPIREHDIRNDAKSGHAVIPLSRTYVTTSHPPWDWPTAEQRTPYRDGAHAAWDAAVFGGLPVYVIAPDGTSALVQFAGAPT